jgi:hypothetical protein
MILVIPILPLYQAKEIFHLPRDFLLLFCLVLPLYFNCLLITCDVYSMFQAFEYIGE